MTVQSNNVGELQGILMALIHQTDKNVEMIIHTDSMYCLNAVSIWHQSWAKNNWITAGGTPVKNKELIKRILEEKGKFKGVYFKHIKGHAIEPTDTSSEEHRDWYGNQMADYLAHSSVHGK
jgi:ribonuclease HI